MKRSEIFTEILKSVIEMMVGDRNLTREKGDDIISNIDFDLSPNERDWFDEVDTDDYHFIVDSILKFDNAEDFDVTAYNQCILAEIPEGYDNEKYPIIAKDDNSDLIVVSSSALKEYFATGAPGEITLVVISNIWNCIHDNHAKCDEFWSQCKDAHGNKYYVLSNDILDDQQIWRAYGYARLFDLNESQPPLPDLLKYDPQTKLTTNLKFQKDNAYCQYFEILHVLGEAKYCSDLLSRFLTIYQVIEHLCYRLAMVGIANSNPLSKGFVRKTIQVANKRNKDEESEIRKGIVKLYPELKDNIDTALITEDFKNFIKDHYEINRITENDDCAKLIYKIRNSIVHNKHTELHFSFGNVKDFEVLVPVINRLTVVLEDLTVKLINNPANKIVEFEKQTIRLY